MKSKSIKLWLRYIIPHPDGGNAHGERARGRYTPNIEETEMDSKLYYHPGDLAGGNFGFKEGSPTFELGIELMDVSTMGPRTKINLG